MRKIRRFIKIFRPEKKCDTQDIVRKKNSFVWRHTATLLSCPMRWHRAWACRSFCEGRREQKNVTRHLLATWHSIKISQFAVSFGQYFLSISRLAIFCCGAFWYMGFRAGQEKKFLETGWQKIGRDIYKHTTYAYYIYIIVNKAKNIQLSNQGLEVFADKPRWVSFLEEKNAIDERLEFTTDLPYLYFRTAGAIKSLIFTEPYFRTSFLSHIFLRPGNLKKSIETIRSAAYLRVFTRQERGTDRAAPG